MIKYTSDRHEFRHLYHVSLNTYNQNFRQQETGINLSDKTFLL
ncbi:hypothetical protein [Okeania sp. SIO2B3]|nr:hypothetical protein [Okeania sp. SIO2B3]